MENEMEKQNSIQDDWINFGRQIASDRRNGKLTAKECNLYTWIRLNVNRDGVAALNIDGLADDVFNGDISTNQLNKLLLSLKRKGYISYERRPGKKGSFEIEVGNFILRDGSVKLLTNFFQGGLNESDDDHQAGIKMAEVSQRLQDSSQRSDYDFSLEKQRIIESFSMRGVRGQPVQYDNDIETNKKNRFDNPIPTEGFRPSNHEEKTCYAIAVRVGEKDMRFLLSILKRKGVGVIETASSILSAHKKPIKNPPAYLNKVIHGLIKANEY